MTQRLTLIALAVLLSTAVSTESRAIPTPEQNMPIVCTPTLNLVPQAPFMLRPVEAQTDLSNLEEMTQTISYGNIDFKVAFDTLGNYRIRCNQREPYQELLIAQGRLPEHDRIFFDIKGPDSNPASRIRLDCAEAITLH